MNDLWIYDIGAGVWSWEAGSSYGNQFSSYGIKNTASIQNQPGGRQQHAAVYDPFTQILYVFAGYGYNTNSMGNFCRALK